MVKFMYQNHSKVTFYPKNSNFKQAIAITNSVIKNSKKTNQINMFKEVIEKKIQFGETAQRRTWRNFEKT